MLDRVRPEPRPVSVTVAITFGWLSVFIDLVSAANLLFLAVNPTAPATIEVRLTDATSAAIGAFLGATILAVVVYRLGKGGSITRILVSVVMVARLLVTGWILAVAGTYQLGEALLTIAVALAALVLLWNPRANVFFATNR